MTKTTITAREDEKPRTGVIARLEAREARLAAWEAERPGRHRKAYWRCYNRLFAVMALITVVIFLVNGRSILWRIDGLQQYYPFFVYEGQWLRGIFASLFAGHLEVPMWSWSLGYGADILTTLDVIFDPFNLASALVPASASEYMYQAMLFVRIWVAGAAFSAYALRRGNGRYATLLGAAAYAFSITLFEGLIWPGSMVGAICLPLVLIGVERVFAHESPVVLVLSSFALFLSSYFFAYIVFLFVIAYCLVRVRQIEPRLTPRDFGTWVAKVAGCVLLGCLMASISLVPALTALFSTARFTEGTVTGTALYSLSYYLGMVPGFLSYYVAGSDCYVGYGAVAFLACAALFADRGRERTLRIAFVVMSVMLLVPAAGSFFNGMNYATNRWVFVYAMLVAYIVTRMAPSLLALTTGRTRILLAAVAIIAAWILLIAAARTERNVAALFCLAFTLVILVVGGIPRQVRRYALVGCLVLAFTVNAFYFVDAGEGGEATSCPSFTAVYQNSTTDSPVSVVHEVSDGSFWRYDVDPSDISPFNKTYSILRNNNLLFGLRGYNFYNSIYDSSIDQFHTELGLAGTEVNFSYGNLGGRSYLEALGSTKYYLMPDDGNETAAYGFNDESKVVATDAVNGGIYKVYEASDPLPLGFTFSSVISRSTYDSLSMASRQEALLQGVVLSDADAGATGLSSTSLDLSNQDVLYSVENAVGCSLEDGQVNVTSSGATLTLSFDGLADAETYLKLDDLSYSALSPVSLAADTFPSLRWYQKAKVLQQELAFSAPVSYTIYARSDKGSANRYISNYVSSYHMYGGKSDWLLNLGYSDTRQTSVTLTFDKVGSYSFDSLGIVCQPMGSYYTRIDALRQDVLENTQVTSNQVTGTISLDADKALFLSIPYSAGWTATVDGQTVDIMKADTAFMAINLSAGDHTVTLTYATPGLSTGAKLTLLGVAMLVILLVLRAARSKHAPAGRTPKEE